MGRRRWTDDELNAVFDRMGGTCWFCKCPIRWRNYGRRDVPMGWEVDHRVAIANGGTDDIANLIPACWTCNNFKGTKNANRFYRGVQRDGPPRWDR